MIDVEVIVSTFLRDDPNVKALVGDRVYTDLPHERTYPLVQFQRTGGGYLTGQPYWLESAVLTFQIFGGTHKQAQAIASTCLSAMASGLRGAYPQGCITAVRETELIYEPDVDVFDDEGHSRPRFLLTATVIAHP
jgi:hypothetical protein